MNSGGDTCVQFIAGAQQLLPAEHLRWTSWGTSEMKLGASRGLKSPVADMTLDGTLSSPCSLCCKCTGRLPATHTVAFSCSLPAPPPPALSSHVWLLLSTWSGLMCPVSEQPSHQPRAASLATLHSSPCLVPSSPASQSVSVSPPHCSHTSIRRNLICLVYGC